MADGNPVWKPGDITLTQFNKPVLFTLVHAASANAGRRCVKYIKDELTRSDRVDTGELRDSWRSETKTTPLGVTFDVYSTMPVLQPSGRTVADIVDRGTGIYGPYGTPIVSPSGGIMKFNWGRKSSSLTSRNVRNNSVSGRFENNTVYAYSVQGQPAMGYIDRARRRIKLTDYVMPG